jgi:hypothetical protein
LQNSPLESSYVVIALTENYNKSKSLKFPPEKLKILSFENPVANERYAIVVIRKAIGLGLNKEKTESMFIYGDGAVKVTT